MSMDRIPNPPAATKVHGTKYPDRGVWITWIISFLVVILTQWYAESLDFAVVNMLMAGGIFACSLAPFIWFVWYSSYSPFARRSGFYLTLAALGILLSIVRIDRFDGSLRPEFRFVWQQTRDQLLGKPIAGEVPEPEVDPASPAVPATVEVGFPQFLGPNRNAYVSGPKLKTDWKKDPPRELWRVPIGAGWGGFAAHSGRAVTLEQRGNEEYVTCYDVATGKVVWAHGIVARHQEIMGGVGPRSTPTIHAGKVYTQGALGMIHCFELSTGKIVWKKDLLELTGVKPSEDQNAILWGRSGSPLIYGDLCVIPAGGPATGPAVSLIAFDKQTGDIVWKGGDQQTGYSSPTVATLHGVEQILIVNEASVAGHDPADGKELWRFAWFGGSTSTATVSQPHPVGDNRVFISKAYGGGMKLLQVNKEGDVWSTEVAAQNGAVMKTKFTNATIIGDYAYALSDSILECVEWKTGKAQWKKGRFGQGQLLGVGDVLLIQAESGEVVLVAATPEKQQELTRFSAIKGITWNNPCLYGKLLLVRNGEEAACFELAVEE